MKVIKFFTLITIVAVFFSCNGQKQTNKSLDAKLDTISYALGMDMAMKLQENFEDDVDNDLFIQGFRDGADSTSTSLVDKDKINEILGAFFQSKQAEMQKKQKEAAQKKVEDQFGDVKAAGIKFLEENKTKEGVKVTESGLQYIVLKQGTGEKPTTASKVKVHYEGTSIDGKVFDSSLGKDPIEFQVTGVIKGWTEALQLMNVGSKFKLFVPQELAYGTFPRQGGPIKPFEMLIFEVELLAIVK